MLDFVPATLASHQQSLGGTDWFLPLPGPYFADQVVALLAALGPRHRRPSATTSGPPRRLPGANLDPAPETARAQTREASTDGVNLSLSQPPVGFHSPLTGAAER
jgi:hypothetical protein